MSGGIIIEDPLMRALVDPDAALEKLWTGAVWWEDGSVTWSDIPSKRMLRWHPVEAEPCFASCRFALKGVLPQFV